MAAHKHTSPTRRGLFGTTAAGLATLALPAAAAAAVSAPADPVLALYAEWRATEDAHTALCDQHTKLRAGFVQRHGELLGTSDGPTVTAWQRDPLKGELNALTDQCSEMSDRCTDLLDAIAATPAASIAGVQCKLLATLDVLRFLEAPHVNPDSVEYHDAMALAVLRDATRVLGAGAVA